MMDDEAQRILRSRLGEDPASVLHQILLEFPDMAAVVVVVETRDGNIVAKAGGCTPIETMGLLQSASIMTMMYNSRQL